MMRMMRFSFCYFGISFLFIGVFAQGVENRVNNSFHLDQHSCLKCHPNSSTKELISLTGDRLPVSKIPELCGQCHGIIKKNFDFGSHGKKINSWTQNGERLSCIKCHDPHRPKFAKMKAVEAPKNPKYLIPKGSHYE